MNYRGTVAAQVIHKVFGLDLRSNTNAYLCSRRWLCGIGNRCLFC